MTLRPRPHIVPVACSVAVTFLMVCGAGVAAATPAPATGTASSAVQWAYGAVSTVHAHHQGLLLGWDATATFGFGVVLGQTAGTAGTYIVSVNRTMGVLLSVHYCRPNCATSVRSGTVSFHAWETTLATLELTRDANVTVATTLTPALGLVSSSLTVKVGLTEAVEVYNGSRLNGSWSLTAFLNGTSSTTFSPALGLMPLTISGPESWTNSSVFQESGQASWSTSEQASGALGSESLGHHGQVPFSRSGTVQLNGSFNGSTVRLGGVTYDVLSLSVAGPFMLRDGYLLLPDASDLFGSTAPHWLAANTTGGAGSASVSGGRLDIGRSLVTGDHLGFGASALWLASKTTSPDTLDTVGIGGPALVSGPQGSAPASGAGSNATFVQGSPESVGQATTDQRCLTTGVGCPGAGSPKLPVGLLALGAVVVIVILLVAVVTERRRVPAPPYPNARLYPPGGPSLAGPTEPRRPAPASPPSEDDPLGHLW